MPTDIVAGNGSANLLYDSAPSTIVNAGGGNDIIVAYGGPASDAQTLQGDLFNGDGGFDTVSYALVGQRVAVDMALGFAYRVLGDGSLWAPDQLNSIEAVLGSGFGDTMLGSGAANEFRGGNGADQLEGLNGNDRLSGDEGGDLLDGGADADTLDGGSGEDTLDGGTGNDLLQGGSGDDTLDGGTGTDTVLFDTPDDVFVDLTFQYAESALGDDWVIGFENVRTGSGDDTVYGDHLGNLIETGAGHDSVFGLNGDDFVRGGDGDDTLDGGDGEDTLDGGNDDDDLRGGGDADLLNGKSGNDTLRGGSGEDVLVGLSGNDLMIGGHGADTITGGAGADIVRWEANDFGIDVINGFQLGVDAISFGTGFLANDPTSFAELADQLLAVGIGGNAFLLADTDLGWQTVARFNGMDGAALSAAIDDYSLFASGSGMGGGPGDFVF